MGSAQSRTRQRPGVQQQAPAAASPPPTDMLLRTNTPYAPPNVYHGAQPPQYYGQDQRLANQYAYGNMWRGPFGQFPPPSGAPHVPQQPVGGAPMPIPQPSQELTQTATIRNAVNLKKDTLKVAVRAGDPQKLELSFSFDASARCSVTTFVLATEESKGCRLTPAKQPAHAPVLYDKGLGLRFPQAGAEAPVIDLSLYDDKTMTHVEGDTYPLVIRLETVTEKGLKQGHSLEELQAGADQKVWVQSQTTFALLVHEEGRWEARVLKQKIWVEGVSYELQEIYGMEHASIAKHAETTNEEDVEERLCVICLVNDRNTTVLPCRHMCMCHECAQELRKQTSKCPICRNHVESLLHIKMQKAAKKGVSAADAEAKPADGQQQQQQLSATAQK